MNWRYYDNRSPKTVEDGIEAESKRGDIGEQWWSRRFVDVVESYSKSTRITRGKRYARKGQIVDLSVEDGLVSAAVQGSRADPYEITIRGDALDEKTWAAVERAMADRAVFYVLAERFDDDPVLIFRRRGRSREALLDNLRELRGVDEESSSGEAAFQKGDDRPIGECLDEFWTGDGGEDAGTVHVRSGTADVADTTLQRLGEPPDELAPVHERIAEFYVLMTEENMR